MSNLNIESLFFYDKKFENKFIFRGKSLWPYCRQYFYKYLKNYKKDFSLSNRKLPLKNILHVIRSHSNLKKSDTIYLISNRPQILDLVNQFQNANPSLKQEKSIYISQLGFDNPTNNYFLYCDFPKFIARGIFLFFSSRGLSKAVRLSLIEAKIQYYYYKILFKILKPKKVYFINWYDHYPALLSLSKEVTTYEIQHGIIYKNHPGYNYGVSNSSKLIIPDNFILWNDNFLDYINLGKTINHEIFNRTPFDQNNIRKFKNCLIIISQHSIRNDIDIEIEKLKGSFTGYTKVVYRIHPKDRSIINDIRKKLIHFNGIIIESPEDTPIELYLDYTNTFVGVFSTLFMDLILQGYNCLILDLPEKNFLNELLIKNNATLL